MWRSIIWFAAVLSIQSCGGEVEQDPTADGSQTTSGEQSGTGSTGAVNTSKPNSRLGDCIPGTPRSRATSCPFLADDVCFPTMDAACNCVCPVDVPKVICLGDNLPEDGVPTGVYCVPE